MFLRTKALKHHLWLCVVTHSCGRMPCALQRQSYRKRGDGLLAAMSDAAAGAANTRLPSAGAPALPTSPASCAASSDTPAGKRKRAHRPPIDIDAKIKDLSKDIEAAQKLLRETKTSQRNERRKKKRLMAKAATLSSVDLERIAVLKRCGLYDPSGAVAFSFPPRDASFSELAPAAAQVESSTKPVHVADVVAPPPVPPPVEDDDDDVEEAVAE